MEIIIAKSYRSSGISQTTCYVMCSCVVSIVMSFCLWWCSADWMPSLNLPRKR